MTRQNPDYGYDIQLLYLEVMLTHAETFVRCQSIFDHELFDSKLQDTAKFINEYVAEHTVLPTFDMVNAVNNVKLKNPGKLEDAHYDWLLTEFETFIIHKGLERAIIAAADLLEVGEYGPVEDLIKKAVQIGLTKDLGTDYFSDPKNRLLKIKDNNGQMSTGWPSLDSVLYGGMNRGELNIFCAQSGGGKSLFLANLGINYALAGQNVVYITLELSEELVSMRMDAMITGVQTKAIFKNLDDVDLKVKMAGKKAGNFQVKYLPSGKTANDIRAYIKEYEVKTNKKIDVLLVDYLDLLMPISKKISAENLFIKDKFVSEELRNLANEKKCVLISAAQINRNGVDETVFDHSHISGGLSKIQTADNVFGIYITNAMRQRGKYQLQFMKTRNSNGVGNTIELDFNIDTMRITDTGVQDNSSSEKSNILTSFQRNSSIVSPPDNTTVKKSEVKYDSSTLRDLCKLQDDDF
jgi:archaellum biogenesis ATPase FlaH